MNKLTLKKAWGRYEKGAELTVLGPGDPIVPFSIDPQRAAQLQTDGFVAAPAADKPASAKSKPAQEA